VSAKDTRIPIKSRTEMDASSPQHVSLTSPGLLIIVRIPTACLPSPQILKDISEKISRAMDRNGECKVNVR